MTGTDSVRSEFRTLPTPLQLQPDNNVEAYDPASLSTSGYDQNTNPQNEPSRSSPLRMLKEVDTFQRINDAARELQRLSQNSGGDLGAHDARFPLDRSSATRDELLLTMRRLSADIARDIGKFSHLEEPTRHFGGKHRGQSSYALPNTTKTAKQNNKRRKYEPCCSMCSCIDTPKWRMGPEGLATLCNVCGLLYAKRQPKPQVVFERRSIASS